MSGGYGYEVNSGWKGYNNVYTLDVTQDNLLAKNTNAEPCCAQKRPNTYPVKWPPSPQTSASTNPTPSVKETRVIGLPVLTKATQELPTFSQAKLLYIGISILLIVIFMKLV